MSFLSEYVTLLQTLFLPAEIQESIYDIDLTRLHQKGYTTLILDVDNTILPYSKTKLSLKMETWIETAKQIGLHVFLISNNSKRSRIEKVCIQTNTKGRYFACKPLPFTIKSFAKEHQFNTRHSIFIGDQVFTDILVGNWLRGYSILVDPLGKKLSFIKTLQRQIELALLEKLRSLPHSKNP